MMDLTNEWLENVDSSHLVLFTVQGPDLFNAVINFRISLMAANFFINRTSIGFSRKSLFHGISLSHDPH
jgi:hypothetical protein